MLQQDAASEWLNEQISTLLSHVSVSTIAMEDWPLQILSVPAALLSNTGHESPSCLRYYLSAAFSCSECILSYQLGISSAKLSDVGPDTLTVDQSLWITSSYLPSMSSILARVAVAGRFIVP